MARALGKAVKSAERRPASFFLGPSGPAFFVRVFV
jgi:hypothetical protein